MSPVVLDTYDYVYLRPRAANTVYYPWGLTWKYVVSSKSTGCFGSTKKYTAVPEAYYYPNYYYVYYYPSEVLSPAITEKSRNTEKKKEKEEDSEEAKEEVVNEQRPKKEVAKKEYEYSDREKWVRTYVPVVDPYYYASTVYVPRALILP
ncbi:conserved Plasmodium protein, unknown function [Plasmodium ovale]|uniref:Sporozoite surface protein essential for liver stage development n=2 Tax=Plasmodium ovale TaxID=36330 RepID=A0A1A8WFX6_PLAOA|nr:conserved Plasmodium protein, unknown function [Plasmodium ovale curtisi]SCP04706.1 conserved Plasmodium protein, unknown function [Plasmodium ovale]